MTEHSGISIIIPSAAAPVVFRECLSAACNQEPAPLEVIIVDDAMDTVAHEIVAQFSVQHPVRILTNSGRGVSAARNAGVRAATGDIILFIDTDVVLQPNALRLIRSEMSQDLKCAGVVGVQSADLRFHNFFSRWKNHWMRFTYQRLTGDVHLFYTSCAAIRREVFLQSGGFDENYRLPSIEDTAFGAALGQKGFRIVPLKEFEVEHVKEYRLWSVLKTDYKRSAALVKYTLRNCLSGKGSGAKKTSVPGSFIAGTLLMGFGWASVLAGIAGCSACRPVAGIMVMALWFVNASWLLYLLREEDWVFFIKGLVFLPLNVTSVILGMLGGAIGFLAGSRY